MGVSCNCIFSSYTQKPPREIPKTFIKMKAFKITAVFGLLLALGSSIGHARPQAEENEEPFNPNPVYTYSYQVANELEQTFIAHTENRDGDVASGEYSYVDPLGNLIKVVYTVNGDEGYSETRTVEENFITIRAKPVTKAVVVEPAPAPAPAPAPEASGDDLVARIISELTPFIKETVATTLSASQQAVIVSAPVPAVTKVVAQAPAAASAVTARFGDGGANNIKVETPEYQFATNF